MVQIQKYKKKNGDTAYKFRVYVGVENGKQKYVRREGFSTIGKARQALLQLQLELEEEQTNGKKINIRDLSKMWLDEYYPTVQESTYIKTNGLIKNHIIPILGETIVSDITPIQMQETVNDWNKKLVYGRKLKGVMNNIFKYAIRYGYIQQNPLNGVINTKRKRSEKTVDFYDKEELKQFLRIVNEKGTLEQLAFFRLLAFTGLRKQEALALEWSDISGNTLSVNKAITRGFDGEQIGLPKNETSKRLVSLDDETIKILKTYKKESSKTTFLFESPSGKPRPTTVARKWNLNLLKGESLRPITIHQFRHTHASLCFEAGMTLKQVQHRLGHSDLKTTMNIYTHITKQAQDDIGNKLASFIDF